MDDRISTHASDWSWEVSVEVVGALESGQVLGRVSTQVLVVI